MKEVLEAQETRLQKLKKIVRLFIQDRTDLCQEAGSLRIITQLEALSILVCLPNEAPQTKPSETAGILVLT